MATHVGLELMKERRRKSVGTSHTETLFHGNGGLFASAAYERQIISALERPISGIGSLMPVLPTTNELTKFGSITGFNVSGDEAATPCDDAPAGTFTKCILDVNFGHKRADSNTMEFSQSAMNAQRGDTRDLILMGRMLGLAPFNPNMSEADMLNMVMAAAMVGVGMQLEDYVIDVTWQGDPSNNNVGGGYKEPDGLDLQITTGIVDAETSVACAAMDSNVADFNFGLYNGTAPAGSTYIGLNLYETLKKLEYMCYQARRKTGLLNGDTAISMPPDLWYYVSEIIPCQMQQGGCKTTLSEGQVLYIDSNTNVQNTQLMRENMTIVLNGRVYPVVEDDGMLVLDNTSNPGDLDAGFYAAQIAFVPLTIMGTFPVLYYEHMDYSASLREFTAPDGISMNQWSDDGRFAWTMSQDGFCIKVGGKTEIRPVLRTPHLAFKVNNISWEG